MKVLNLIHAYPPLHHAGAEWMVHEMNKYLVDQGHSVDVLLPITGIKDYNFEGVNVKGDFYPGNREYIKNADIIISHLDRAGRLLTFVNFIRSLSFLWFTTRTR